VGKKKEKKGGSGSRTKGGNVGKKHGKGQASPIFVTKKKIPAGVELEKKRKSLGFHKVSSKDRKSRARGYNRGESVGFSWTGGGDVRHEGGGVVRPVFGSTRRNLSQDVIVRL